MQRSVEDTLAKNLRTKLTTIFRRVAERAEPARDRYTRQAFEDGLLGPLSRCGAPRFSSGAATRPRVKSPEGFVMLKDAIVEENEISGFLMALLTERQQGVLRDEKEVTTLYDDGGQLGAFRVSIFEEEGAPTILITPSRRDPADRLLRPRSRRRRGDRTDLRRPRRDRGQLRQRQDEPARVARRPPRQPGRQVRGPLFFRSSSMRSRRRGA